MFVKPRLLVVGATTLVALGAGAAPALASGRGPAAQEVLKLQPRIQENIGPIRTPAQQRKTMAALLVNAKRCDHAARIVGHTHPMRPEGKELWVKGVRLQATGDREFASGLRLQLAGNTAAGKKKVNAAVNAKDNALDQANTVVVRADKQLGVYRALAKIENG